MPEPITSKNIQGISDLVVCAPIKPGFIAAFENVTYETRLRLATEAFYKLRDYAREYELIKPFTDVAERLQSLLAFRIGVIDTKPLRSMVLAVTFDRAWEPYMRTVWDPLGAFLDVVLCNCEGYVTAMDHSFPEYAKWVRDHQVDSLIFYATTPLTVGDQQYLTKMERLQRAGASDWSLATMTADAPEDLAGAVRGRAILGAAGYDPAIQQQFLTMSVEALEVLYRLADYYPPDRLDGDGKYLLRATQDLFAGWDTTDPNQLPPVVRQVKKELFAWFYQTPPGRPKIAPDPAFVPSEVQAGILSPYGGAGGEPIQHGAVLLFSVSDPQNAREFLSTHTEVASWEGEAGKVTDDGSTVFVNLAITYAGFAGLGLGQTIIDALPREFSQGMADRAPLMGDIYLNHPDRWTLPERFVYADADPGPRVELSEIDLVVQLRTTGGGWDHTPLPNDQTALEGSTHPLTRPILDNIRNADKAGVTLLAIQSMRRIAARDLGGQVKTRSDGAVQTHDHFGFDDAVSQPSLAGEAGVALRDVVRKGELILGYGNDRNDPPAADPFQKNGSFLVIRKMRQDVGAVNALVDAQTTPPLTRDDLLSKMVGRHLDGDTLVKPPPAPAGVPQPFGNDFNYKDDPTGEICPFQAHIRRANPRLALPTDNPPFKRPTPRITRRGMSYGPTLEEDPASTDRGAVFMAYNASIAEQFEVIQRWINGGNATGAAAAQNDPLFGTFPAAGAKIFRFVDGGDVVRTPMPKPTVALEWGLYAFAPSKTALRGIVDSIATAPQLGDPDHGEAIIADILAMDQDDAQAAWKVYLEDFTTKDPDERCDSPDVWAAIREGHGGAMRTPNGVIVASAPLIDKVLLDEDRNYSVAGQTLRMQQSIGEIYVGLDPGQRYDDESTFTNTLLMGVARREAFAVAFGAATAVLGQNVAAAAGVSQAMKARYPVEFDLRSDFLTPALEAICKEWFGLPDSDLDPLREVDQPARPPFFEAGGWNWQSPAGRKARCPGDFMAPSRYCFYPDPTDAIVGYGVAQGQSLRATAKSYFDAIRGPTAAPGAPTAPPGRLAGPMFGAIADNDLLARTLIGVMVGALPPMDGNLRSTFYDWLQDKSFWRWQGRFLRARCAALDAGASPDPLAAAFAAASDELEQPMKRAMQKRPAPDLLWRTASRPHRLGEVEVETGDKIILVLVSATQAGSNAGDAEVDLVFGGKRKAVSLADGSPAWSGPVHACPAYEMAMGTMLGIVAGLMAAGQVEALPAPLLVRLTPSPPAPGTSPSPSTPGPAPPAPAG